MLLTWEEVPNFWQAVALSERVDISIGLLEVFDSLLVI